MPRLPHGTGRSHLGRQDRENRGVPLYTAVQHRRHVVEVRDVSLGHVRRRHASEREASAAADAAGAGGHYGFLPRRARCAAECEGAEGRVLVPSHGHSRKAKASSRCRRRWRCIARRWSRRSRMPRFRTTIRRLRPMANGCSCPGWATEIRPIRVFLRVREGATWGDRVTVTERPGDLFGTAVVPLPGPQGDGHLVRL